MSQSHTSSNITSFIRTGHRSVAAVDILRSSPSVLLGVSAAATAALEKLNIKTVFDLATSSVFDAAKKITAASEDTRSLIYRYGVPSSDLIRASRALAIPLNELKNAPLALLATVPEADADMIQAALDVSTVRDLSIYPPYLAAVAFLNQVYFPENKLEYDPDEPPDLLPRSGEYPVEKVKYSTLIMGEINQPVGAGAPPLSLINIQDVSFTPLDLSKLAAATEVGFKTVAFGALLSFTQSWFAQGVTLGHLLHSVTLAPGECTRVAIIDWSRKTKASGQEDRSEKDSIENTADNSRAISEVTSAVASQAQEGFSATTSESSATQKAAAVSLSGGASSPFYSVELNASASIAQQNASAHSASYSTSAGRTDVGSDMLQQVSDRTHQAAHSSRNMRASVVKEVSQEEHEKVSTRVLTNYNHSHAMTIQYYEVVQIFRVEVQLAQVDKVVFIPITLPNFNDENVIRRFQTSLASAALGSGIFEALMSLDMFELAPEEADHIHWAGTGGLNLKDTRMKLRVERLFPTLGGLQNMQTFIIRSNRDKDTGEIPPLGAPREPEPEPTPTPAPATPVVTPAQPVIRIDPPAEVQRPVVRTINDNLWVDNQVSQLSGLLGMRLLKSESNSLWLPADLLVMGWSVTTSPDKIDSKLVIHNVGGVEVPVLDESNPLSIRDIKSIGVVGSSPTKDLDVTATLVLNRNGVRFPLNLPSVKVTKGFGAETRFLFGKTGGITTNIKQHLNANRMHYTQAIYKGLDAMQLAFMLSGYGCMLGGKLVPLAQVVEPKPIRYVGNYLVFKTNVSPLNDPDWKQFLTDKKIQVNEKKEELVPIGSGGTFAEGILGRSNCSEKLDMTRFWNWQDSPIPILPTEIAPIQMGSRATAEDTKASGFSAPLINMSTPTSMPDPTGTANVLAAVQNGNMFRDMSGLQATIQANQAALAASSAGANSAQAASLQAAVETAKVGVDRQRIAANTVTDLAKTAAALELGKQTKPSNHSEEGAKANWLQKATVEAKQDAVKAVPKAQPKPGGGTGGGGGGGTGGTGGSGGGGGGTAPGGQPPMVAIDDSDTPIIPPNDSSVSLRNNPAMALVSGRPLVMDMIDDAVDSLGSVGKIFGSPSNFISSANSTPSGVFAENKDGFVHLQGDVGVPERLQVLAREPELFCQGIYESCQAALFWFHIAKLKPREFIQCGLDLLRKGTGKLGSLTLEPDNVVKKANYYQLRAEQEDPNTTYPPPADWMLIVSSLNNLNFIDRFLEWARHSTPGDGRKHDWRFDRPEDYLIDLYEATGFYTAIKRHVRPESDWYNPNAQRDAEGNRIDDPLPAGEPWRKLMHDTLGPGSPGQVNLNMQIGLKIDLNFLNDARQGRHMVTMEEKYREGEANGLPTVAFRYWTWARYRDAAMTFSKFTANVTEVYIMEFAN